MAASPARCADSVILGRGPVEHGAGLLGLVEPPVKVERPDAGDFRPLGIGARLRELARQQAFGRTSFTLAHQGLR